MNVRWIAVITGFIVDTVLSSLLLLFVSADFGTSSVLSTSDLAILCLSVVLTTVSGYVAGRMAGVDRTLNGFLVQIVQILVGQLDANPQPRIFTISLAVACAFAALGGYLSRFPMREPGLKAKE